MTAGGIVLCAMVLLGALVVAGLCLLQINDVMSENIEYKRKNKAIIARMEENYQSTLRDISATFDRQARKMEAFCNQLYLRADLAECRVVVLRHRLGEDVNPDYLRAAQETLKKHQEIV